MQVFYWAAPQVFFLQGRLKIQLNFAEPAGVVLVVLDLTLLLPCKASTGGSAMLAGDVYKLFEDTADAAFAVTPEGEINFWNSAAERLFGYSAAEVAGRTCQEVLKGKGILGTRVCGRGCSVQLCAEQNKSVPTFDLEVLTHSGTPKWVNVSTIVFDDSRVRQRLILHLARDISGRREIESTFVSILELSKQIVAIGEKSGKPAPVVALSDQEKRILKLFARARNSRQVASELGITLPTLRNHLHAINQKLRTHGRLEAVLHAMRRGLID